MFVRSVQNDQDTRSIILKAIGRLADTNISDDSRQIAINELTNALKGQPMNEETFKKYDIQAELIKTENRPEVLEITVPKEFLPIALAENNDTAKVSFTVTKVMDMDFRGR